MGALLFSAMWYKVSFIGFWVLNVVVSLWCCLVFLFECFMKAHLELFPLEAFLLPPWEIRFPTIFSFFYNNICYLQKHEKKYSLYIRQTN